MKERKNIIIFISLQTYLRNWIDAGAFDKLHQDHNVHYVIPEYDFDPKEIENYGIKDYTVVSQSTKRKFLFRRMLLITMIRYSKRSMAFKIKTQKFSSPFWKFVNRLAAQNGFYHLFIFITKLLLGRWKEMDELIARLKPDLVVAPSLAADSFTIDLTHTCNLVKLKSVILINSWDNLVSKGVMPIQPSYVALWGDQGYRQAIEVQRLPKEKLKILGVPRFESYFKRLTNDISIHEVNGVPAGKKIILYPSTVLPFDDNDALRSIDQEISDNPEYQDYVILFRSHPEMMPRVDEIDVREAGFKNVYIDSQTADFYFSRFEKAGATSYGSTINSTSLDYYPALLNEIVGMVCPATTLSLEGLINGKPCVMICYHDGKHDYLSADKIAKFENVQEILSLTGVFPVYDKEKLLENFREMIKASQNEQLREKTKKGTFKIVYTDETPYPERLANFVAEVI